MDQQKHPTIPCHGCASLVDGGQGFCQQCGLGADPSPSPAIFVAVHPTEVPLTSGSEALTARMTPAPAACAFAPVPPPLLPEPPEHASLIRRLPRPTRRTVLVVCGLLFALVAGVVVWDIVRPTPQSVVEHYFADLARGDAAGALALVDYADGGGSSPLLAQEALADPADRPRHLKIIRSLALSSVLDDGGAEVDVSYMVRGSTVRQEFDVLAVPGPEAYRLIDPFVMLGVFFTSDRGVTVNGVALSEKEMGAVQAFPGSYTVLAHGTVLLATDQHTVHVVGPAAAEPEADVFFGQPVLAVSAAKRIQERVDQVLDGCAAQSTADSPADGACPFSSDLLVQEKGIRRVVWKVTQYPDVEKGDFAVPDTSVGSVFFSCSKRGSVHYTDTYTDWDGTTQRESGDEDFKVTGTATATSNGIVVALD